MLSGRKKLSWRAGETFREYNIKANGKLTFADFRRWVRTGDEVEFDAEGNIYVVDRLKVRDDTLSHGNELLKHCLSSAGIDQSSRLPGRPRRIGRTPLESPRRRRRVCHPYTR